MAITTAKKCRPIIDPIGQLPEFLRRLKKAEDALKGKPGIVRYCTTTTTLLLLLLFYYHYSTTATNTNSIPIQFHKRFSHIFIIKIHRI